MVTKNAERIPLSQQNSFRVGNNGRAEYIPRMTDAQDSNSDFKLRLRTLMAEKKLSAQGLSLTAGLHRDTVRKLLDSDSQLPQSKTLTGLARALHTSEQWLLRGEGPKGVSPAGDLPEPFEDPGGPSRKRLTKYTDVLGTAAGSHGRGTFQFTSNWAKERVLVPEGIAHLPNVYAINIEGDSMSPEHKAGEIRFVVPTITPQLGDSVVVEFQREPDGEVEAMIGHLLKRRPLVALGKINPENVVEIDASTVLRLHRIATYSELAGRSFL